jgi:hypothetical protein
MFNNSKFINDNTNLVDHSLKFTDDSSVLTSMNRGTKGPYMVIPTME